MIPLNYYRCFVFAATLLGLLLISVGASASDADSGEKKVYKTIGPGGEVIYSDQPSKGAKEITVPPGSQYTPTPVPDFTPYQAPSKQPVFNYNTFAIRSPANDEALWPESGDVTIEVELIPGLRSDHSLQYVLDGNAIDNDTLSYTYRSLDRGTHTVYVQVLDENDKVIQKTAAVSFHVKRHFKR